MFEPLFARLSDRYSAIMSRFTEALALSRYTLYMQNYGGPWVFAMALAHPERIEALIVQRAPHESLVSGDDPDAPCRQRSQCGAL